MDICSEKNEKVQRKHCQGPMSVMMQAFERSSPEIVL